MTSILRSISGWSFCQPWEAGVIQGRAGISQTATLIAVLAPPPAAGAAACGAVLPAGAWVGAGAAPARAGLVGSPAAGFGADAAGALVGAAGGLEPQAARAAEAAPNPIAPKRVRREISRLSMPSPSAIGPV